MKAKSVSYLFIIAVLAGCATTVQMKTLQPDETAYVTEFQKVSNTFTLSKEKSEEAWERASIFLAKYSDLKVQESTTNYISTYSPVGKGAKLFGYSMLKEPVGKNEVKFTVSCMRDTVNFAPAEVCNNNEKVAAYYMITGNINPKFVNVKIGQDK